MGSAPLPRLPTRQVDSHKGSFGNALIVGGSRGMSGAIALAGMSAVRSGAGLVRLAVPDCCLETVAGYSPCPMTIPLPNDELGRIEGASDVLSPWIAKSDCIAIGPGMGQSSALQTLLVNLVAAKQCPLVVDADGLNNLSVHPNWAESLTSTAILTPHPGEWQRLCGVAAEERERQVEAARAFAHTHATVVVLKGHRTVITDGERCVWNETGTPAMATGGSGDVLTGVITALVCQGLAPFEAAQLGVHVHGRSAELAEQALRTHVVLPTELIAYLPAAFAELRS